MREPFKVSWIAVFFAIFRENNNLTKSSSEADCEYPLDSDNTRKHHKKKIYQNR